MREALRFLVLLVAGLALLTWLTFSIAVRATVAWFERDLALRSSMAVAAARQPLADAWNRGDRRRLDSMLADVARSERVLGVRACDLLGREVTTVGQYPDAAEATCAALAYPPGSASVYGQMVQTRGGQVHVTAVPVDDATALGTLVFAHDATFMDLRRTQIRALTITAFFVLAVGASIFTLIVMRLSWHGWNRDLRAALLGGEVRPRYAPLLKDVLALAHRISEEAKTDREAQPWGPQRLRAVLHEHLHGERVTIVANREPYIHERGLQGEVRVLHPASGLVTALEPVMRACSGVWIAHASGSADRDFADAKGRLLVPPGEQAETYTLRRVWLTAEQERGYYYGFSNEGVWPLCHIAHTRPVFRGSDWEQYRAVNALFASAACEEATGDDPIVLVQDYHFALVPAMIRKRLPRATILTFWHVPWPNAERFAICPWKDDLVSGLLGSSIVGFHTQLHCNNFFETVDRCLEARIDRERFAVNFDGRATLVKPYPISIDWPSHWATTAPPADACRRAVLEELALPRDVLLGVGVDRLDYTKGIEERLLAVERLLERHPRFMGRFVFVQLAAPSRSAIEEYQHVDARVSSIADRVNARFGRGAWHPIVLKRAHHEPPEVFRYYRAADVCYVSSLHDGMNLVAKEFVAARDDGRGVLVLSTFAGAARELTEALIVNPYDLDEASDAMALALDMPAPEQRDRLRTMRSYLAQFNVYRWAGRMLVDAARVRERERLAGRLSLRPARDRHEMVTPLM